MAQVKLIDICKVYDGNVTAVDKANIFIKDEEFVVLVGPSGCGKSTTLRMVAGLEDISSGDLLIDGKRMNDEAPKNRDIAMVFQNYALYPHMTVYDNMAFGLKIRKLPKEEIDKRVKEAAGVLDIEGLLNRKPKALSGGQRQRVAVGRAIVRNPKVFLFDEPLSNLDAKLRVQMRAEISGLHHRLKATIIYVTHDQVEAMTMGSQIVVMKGGRIQQIGAPLDLYNCPINRFVATFIGTPPMNVSEASVIEENGVLRLKAGGLNLAVPEDCIAGIKAYGKKSLLIGLRPEDLEAADMPDQNANIAAKVEVVEPLGAETQLYLNTGAAQIAAKCSPQRSYKIGDTVNLKPDMAKAHFFDIESELSLFYKGSYNAEAYKKTMLEP